MHSLRQRSPQNLPLYQIWQVEPTWTELQQLQWLWRKTNQVPKVIRHAAAKKLVYLSRYSTWQEMLDDPELVLENLGNRALFATLDEIQPHRITLKSRVILEGRALMSSQYLWGTERPDSAHIIHEVLVWNMHGNGQRVQELIDCGAMSIFILPSLLRKLELPHEPAFTSTQGPNGHVMMSAKESRKASLLPQYVEYLEPDDESEVLVVPMKAYDLVLGLAWFKARNPEIDWSKGRLSAPRTPNGSQWATMWEPDRASPLLECGEENPNDEPPLDIQLPWDTTFGHPLASEEVVEAFPIQLAECQGLLGESLERITEGEGNPRMLNARAGALRVVAAEEWHSDGAWGTATGSPRHEGRNWTIGVVYCDEPSDPAIPGPLPISTLPKHASMQTRLMRIGIDTDNVEMVTTEDRVTSQHNIKNSWRSSARKTPWHSHRTGQLTTRSICNLTTHCHTGGSTISQSLNWRSLMPTLKQTWQTASFNGRHPRPLHRSCLQRKKTEDYGCLSTIELSTYAW